MIHVANARIVISLNIKTHIYYVCSSISKYEFSTLEKGEADDYPGNTLLYRTMQRELSMPFAEYKPVVKYDLSQHEVWCDNRLEGGDLRTREAICACDRCLEGR